MAVRIRHSNLLPYYPPPIAEALPTPAIGCEDLLVSFDNSSQNTDISTWDFGDGNSSTDENPTHLFKVAGTY